MYPDRGIYFFIYSRPLWNIVLIIPVFVLMWMLWRSFPPKFWRKLNTVLFAVSVIGILWLTLFMRGGTSTEAPCFIPFHSLEAAKIQPELYREMLMNMFLYVPLGMTLPNALPGKYSGAKAFGITILCGVILSIGCEAVQLIFSLGLCETDDVITNLLGTLCGALHVPLSAGIIRLGRRDTE